MAQVCEDCGNKTLSDICRSEDKLTPCALKFSVDAGHNGSVVGLRKHMKRAHDEKFETMHK